MTGPTHHADTDLTLQLSTTYGAYNCKNWDGASSKPVISTLPRVGQNTRAWTIFVQLVKARHSKFPWYPARQSSSSPVLRLMDGQTAGSVSSGPLGGETNTWAILLEVCFDAPV